jgi:hypothetical protein
MNIKELLLSSKELVNTLIEGINLSDISLKEAEERILEFVNKVGQVITDDLVKNIKEPTVENGLVVNGEVAKYHEMRRLRFINRFGGETVRLRRCYKYEKGGGGYYV